MPPASVPILSRRCARRRCSLGAAGLGDVLGGADDADNPAVTIENRKGAIANPTLAPVGQDDAVDLVVAFDGLARGGVGDTLAILWMYRLHPRPWILIEARQVRPQMASYAGLTYSIPGSSGEITPEDPRECSPRSDGSAPR